MKDFLILSSIILLMDLLWLKYAVKNLWEDNVRSVQKSDMKVDVKYALLSYIVIIIGIYMS